MDFYCPGRPSEIRRVAPRPRGSCYVRVVPGYTLIQAAGQAIHCCGRGQGPGVPERTRGGEAKVMASHMQKLVWTSAATHTDWETANATGIREQ